jgi:hypothetical protein
LSLNHYSMSPVYSQEGGIESKSLHCELSIFTWGGLSLNCCSMNPVYLQRGGLLASHGDGV